MLKNFKEFLNERRDKSVVVKVDKETAEKYAELFNIAAIKNNNGEGYFLRTTTARGPDVINQVIQRLKKDGVEYKLTKEEKDEYGF